jgi:hypothetical protein
MGQTTSDSTCTRQHKRQVNICSVVGTLGHWLYWSPSVWQRSWVYWPAYSKENPCDCHAAYQRMYRSNCQSHWFQLWTKNLQRKVIVQNWHYIGPQMLILWRKVLVQTANQGPKCSRKDIVQTAKDTNRGPKCWSKVLVQLKRSGKRGHSTNFIQEREVIVQTAKDTSVKRGHSTNCKGYYSVKRGHSTNCKGHYFVKRGHSTNCKGRYSGPQMLILCRGGGS